MTSVPTSCKQRAAHIDIHTAALAGATNVMTETETSFIRPNTRIGDDAAIARNRKTKPLSVFLSTRVQEDTADKPNMPIIPTQDINRSL